MINGQKIRLQLDTASDITIISPKSYEVLGGSAVRPSNHIASNASGDVLKLEGGLECQVCLGNRQIQTKCFLTEHPDLDLLGLDWLDELGVLKRIISTIAEDQMPTPVTNLTERAEKKSALGRNRQKDQVETVIRVEARTKADSGPTDTKKDRIKGRCTKTKANHQTQMKESVIANIALEKDIRSILADSIRNIPVTADEIRQESTKDAVIRKAMN